ncbi:MAG: AMP-binding protein [Pseudomonadota bacterium]
MTHTPDALAAPAPSIFEIFAPSAAKYPEHEALHIPGACRIPAREEADSWSYAQLHAHVDDLAERLAKAGYGCGHRIATALDNSADFFIHFLACNKLGVSIVPLNAGMPPEELAYLIGHSDCAFVIAAAHHEAHISAAITHVDRDVPLVVAWNSVPDAPAPLPNAWQMGLNAEAAILYTSGTTGKPKGCMMANEYFVMVAAYYKAMGGHCTLEDGKERLITPLPVNHMNAMACSFPAMMMTGGCLIQLDRFSPSSWWDHVRETKATCLHYLGVMPAMLLNKPESAADDFSSQIKFGFGAGVDPKHQINFERRFGFPLIEAWAMTETGAGGWMSCENEPRFPGQRCIGVPRAHMEVKLVGEDGAEVPVGAPGELLVRTKGDNPRRYFFTAYYKDDKATAEAWAGDYFHTGDVVRADDDGFYYFVDRNKNIVRRSGENIAAVEVESVIAAQDGIENLAVVPVPDDIRGEEVCALLILKAGFAGDEGPTEDRAKAIQTAVSEALVYFKSPGWVGFVDALPHTASNKLARGEVKKLARALLEEGKLYDLRDGKRGSRKAS